MGTDVQFDLLLVGPGGLSFQMHGVNLTPYQRFFAE